MQLCLLKVLLVQVCASSDSCFGLVIWCVVLDMLTNLVNKNKVVGVVCAVSMSEGSTRPISVGFESLLSSYCCLQEL